MIKSTIKMRIPCFFLIIICCYSLAAQFNCDSLKKIYEFKSLETIAAKANEYLDKDFKVTLCLSELGIEKSSVTNNIDYYLQFKGYQGYALKLSGNFELSIKTFINAFKTADSLKLTTRAAYIANNIGASFLETGNYNLARNYLNQAIFNAQIRKDSLQLARSYTNYGYLLQESNQPDSAITFFKKALSVFLTIKDSLRIADCYLNIGRSENSLNNVNLAIKYFNESTLIYRLKKDIDGLCRGLLNLSETYLIIGNLNKSLDYCLKAKEEAQKLNSVLLLYYCYISLSEIYQKQKLYENSLNFYKRATEINDSINSSDKQKEIMRLQEKYQSEKKDKLLLENQLIINEQKMKQNWLLVSVISSVLILIIISLFLFKLKKNNKTLNKYLKEKDYLVNEVHHRVKNNLQLLSSLFEMEIRNLNNKELINILHDCQNRVMTIATIHHKLHKQSNVEYLELNVYLKELISDLIATFNNGNISFKINFKPITIHVDKCIKIGIIVNEIVTNTLKYSNKTENLNCIFTLSSENNNIKFSYQDNGKGLPDSFENISNKSTGLKLVKFLIKQLQGEIIAKNGIGLTYIILIRNENRDSRR